jgi:hypothetical protein
MAHESGAEDPLANGRVTLIGHCRRLVEPAAIAAAREAYLAVHPQSSYYADFKDFGFWKLSVATLRYIGGYGRMSWVEVADWRAASADPLAADAAGIVEHMNKDHADALVAYARAFTRATEADDVRWRRPPAAARRAWPSPRRSRPQPGRARRSSRSSRTRGRSY